MHHMQILLLALKKAATNVINKIDNKCFQYTTKVMLNHEKTTKTKKNKTKKMKETQKFIL